MEYGLPLGLPHYSNSYRLNPIEYECKKINIHAANTSIYISCVLMTSKSLWEAKFKNCFSIWFWYDVKIWIWCTLNLGLWFRYGFVSFWYGFRYDLDMVLECFGYDFDMVLTRFWCDVDVILIWFWYGSGGLASKKETETAPGTGFWSISRGFLWFWYVFKWFWYGFDTVLMRFWGDVDVIWFWYVFKLYIHVCVYVCIYLFIYLTKKHIHTIENLKRNINHTFDPPKTQIWPISKL